MGLRYSAFRMWYEIQLRTGRLAGRFPTKTRSQSFISLKIWRELPVKFFFEAGQINVKKNKSLCYLKDNALNISQDRFQYFSSKWYSVADWHTNPETGFTYNAGAHWTRIPDFSRESGDIKYVWEKSRFTFLYDLIRYDYHFENDQSSLVFELIADWTDRNPVNCGPNWKCSQEITLRVLNWVFALHYYRFSKTLNQERFDKIMNSIHQQIRHVEENISFSLIAVRSNHALTECLGLYLIGLLFPFFPESGRWKEKGKRYFEQEISYQIYPDGTFLQFSMNYHRIVVQLLTWAIGLADLNGEKWGDVVYDRAEKSLLFLRTCQDEKTGQLPNYGNNDGALFFPITSCEFRDFRPQLAALGSLLGFKSFYENGEWEEEAAWFSGRDYLKKPKLETPAIKPVSTFPDGSYHVLRDYKTIAFLRCGSYKNRPFQADHLHLDIWVDGHNILRDAGSYLYNTDEKWTKYFSGTASHNTVMLGDFDQMQKCGRFIWWDWIKKAKGSVNETPEHWLIEAELEGFGHLGKGISHKRKVFKRKGYLEWIIEDSVRNAPPDLPMNQIWHPSDEFFDHYHLRAYHEDGSELTPIETEGWFSETYGSKMSCRRVVFSSSGRFIRAVIRWKE